MELLHGSLLVTTLVYALFGFCIVGGICCLIGTGYRIHKFIWEKHSTHHKYIYKERAIVWSAWTIVLWIIAIAMDIYVF